MFIGSWGISGLLLGIGWHHKKRWLMWLGGVPFALISLGALGMIAFIAFNIARSAFR